jgi:hypothetical protein
MKKIMMADVIKDISDSYLEERALRIKELTDQFNITKDDATNIVDNYNDYDTQDLIATAMDEYKLNLGDAEIFVDDYPNESDWAQVADAADALDLDITDISPDDVESMNEVDGTAVGKIESSAAEFVYKLAIGTGLYYLWATFPNGKVVGYQNLEPYEIKGIIENGGAYYVSDIRIDSPEPDPKNPKVWFGCRHNPGTPAQINAKPNI